MQVQWLVSPKCLREFGHGGSDGCALVGWRRSLRKGMSGGHGRFIIYAAGMGSRAASLGPRCVLPAGLGKVQARRLREAFNLPRADGAGDLTAVWAMQCRQRLAIFWYSRICGASRILKRLASKSEPEWRATPVSRPGIAWVPSDGVEAERKKGGAPSICLQGAMA